jgi:hypothetical protein
MASSLPEPWAVALKRRMRRHLVVKAVGTTVAIGLFFIGYFHLQNNPAYPVTVMPLTVLDHLIPFQPQALFAYLSLWLYVGIGPGLQSNAQELIAYGAWIGLLCVAGLLIFHFWPTQVPPPGVDVSQFFGFSILHGVDAAGNACPSMHVAIATFTVIRVRDVLRRIDAPLTMHIVNVVWFAAIALSTVAIKQHVVLDAVAGALLGTAFAIPSCARAPLGGRPLPVAVTGNEGR